MFFIPMLDRAIRDSEELCGGMSVDEVTISELVNTNIFHLSRITYHVQMLFAHERMWFL